MELYGYEGTKSFLSAFRFIEGFLAEVNEWGMSLEEVLEDGREFTIPSEMMAIDTLVEYGWERAVRFALNSGAKPVDLLTPHELCSYVGTVIVNDLTESMRFIKSGARINDDELKGFLEWLDELPEDAKYEYGNIPELDYRDIVHLYHSYSGEYV